MQGSSPHHRCVSSLSLVSSLSHLVRVASQVPHPYHGEDSPLRTTSIVSTCLWWSGGGSRRDPSKNSLSLAPSLSLSCLYYSLPLSLSLLSLLLKYCFGGRLGGRTNLMERDTPQGKTDAQKCGRPSDLQSGGSIEATMSTT